MGETKLHNINITTRVKIHEFYRQLKLIEVILSFNKGYES